MLIDFTFWRNRCWQKTYILFEKNAGHVLFISVIIRDVFHPAKIDNPNDIDFASIGSW